MPLHIWDLVLNQPIKRGANQPVLFVPREGHQALEANIENWKARPYGRVPSQFVCFIKFGGFHGKRFCCDAKIFVIILNLR